MAQTFFEKNESNVRVYCRSFPTIFNRAEGANLYDEEGKQYIDFLSGAGALNYGHNHPAIREKLIAYIAESGITHSLDLHTSAKRDFIHAFKSVILEPRALPYRFLFPGPTGTNAVEAALKIARKATGRTQIAAFTNAFHGMSLGSLATSGNSVKRRGAGSTALLPGVDRYAYDGYFGDEISTIDMIRQLLADPSSGYEPPAAFIVETIQAEGGVNVASASWLQELADLAREHGSLLIVDDIQAGCGRSGKFFSFEEAEIVPDIVCLSKSLSGYGLPLSLVLVKNEFDVLSPGEHNGTFRGHNLAFISATAATEFWSTDEMSNALKQRVNIVEQRLKDLQQLVGADQIALKGKGLLQGVACNDKELAALVSLKAFEYGVIVETCGKHDEVLKLLPPLNIDLKNLNDGLSIIERAFLNVLPNKDQVVINHAVEMADLS